MILTDISSLAGWKTLGDWYLDHLQADVADDGLHHRLVVWGWHSTATEKFGRVAAASFARDLLDGR